MKRMESIIDNLGNEWPACPYCGGPLSITHRSGEATDWGCGKAIAEDYPESDGWEWDNTSKKYTRN